MKSRASLMPLAILFLMQTVSFPVFAEETKTIEPLELPKVDASFQPPYYSTTYEQPTDPKEGQLQIGVTYTLWIPEGLKEVRGIIVHQHGCGSGSCTGSVTAAHDLHWQELARKNNCALLGPSFHQAKEQNCRLWCDPRNGSNKVFIESLKKLAKHSGHPEVATAPWCLWGHSGGGFWSSLMQMEYPERIVAIWFQSGTAFGYWTAGEITAPTIPEAAMQIPMMANPGLKEKENKRFSRAWTGSLAMFKDYRAKGAPIGFAPDPKTGHETGDSRYLAIPFFNACLQMRLPEKVGEPLKTIDVSEGWLAPLNSEETPVPFADYKGDKATAVWLPNKTVAMAWLDFVKTGATKDTTPPPAPTNVKVDSSTGKITWTAPTDFESGLHSFIIERNGKQIGQLPEKPTNRFGRPLFQGMSYGDTPVLPLLKFQFVDKTAENGKQYQYRVKAVNTAGLQSK
ncbi:hypothetical protein [Gimesia fumaroli]|uniref:Fibronectin type-III domain-containing protein n=1 Tax=Gimesia fumaroli TaxID=2527976 RepID=A0A518IH31_9PLAN|nr:hypothetical protein [Gimesia fumaroli]QDV52394.1 hypothetical protein Enr17x_44560 [Gimesia fumaroli]